MSYWKNLRRLVAVTGLVTGLAGLALAGDWADITPRRTGDYDANKGTGYCMIRLRVDIETIVHVRGDRVGFETMAGRQSTDEGTECSQPLPSGNGLANFKFRGVDGRGEQTLLEAPSANNSWTAKIRIRDSRGGDEGYTGRIEWDNRGGSSAWDSTGWRGTASDPVSSSSNRVWGTTPSNSASTWGGNGAGGNEFDGTVAGSGSFERRNGSASDITEARVALLRNGMFRLDLRGSRESYDLGGRWIRRGNGAALEITRGFRNSGATGRGNIEFEGNQLVRMSLTGMDTGANSEFRSDFQSGAAPNSAWGTGAATNSGVRGASRSNAGWGTDARSDARRDGSGTNTAWGTGGTNSAWGTTRANSGWGSSPAVRAYSGTSTGSGSFWVTGGRQMRLTEARLEIRANGEALLEFRGQSTPSFFGRVENQTDNEATIRVSRFVQSTAEGTIRVQVSGGQIDSVDGQVRAQIGGDVNVNFRR